MFAVEAECPQCKSVMRRYASKDNPKEFYWHCTNKDCNLYLTDDKKGKPVVIRCPECKKGYLRKRQGKKGAFWSCTSYPNCKCVKEDQKGKPVL